MLKYYAIHNQLLYSLSEEEIQQNTTKPIWIDIYDPTSQEEELIEDYLKIDIPTPYEMTAIALSNRLYQKTEGVYATTTIINTEQETQAVTFILTKDKIITLSYATFHSFQRYLTYSKLNLFDTLTPHSIFAGLIESTINQISDSLEEIGRCIDKMAYHIFHSNQKIKKKKVRSKVDYNKIITQIGSNGDLISKNHESLTSIYRALRFITESKQLKMASQDQEKLNMLMNDIPHLNEHTAFLSNKINFLLDACLGMINNEQNTIIKIVSVAALIFFPPTLIASIYGMNFDIIPELKWGFGYPFAILLMILSGALPYFYFRRKNWI